MNLQTIIDTLALEVLTEARDFSTIEPASGYTSDLLSCVMAGAHRSAIWVTLQAHGNVVAVAALLDLAAIIITENARPDESVIQKANAEGIILLATPLPSYIVVGRLWEIGLQGEVPGGGSAV